MGMLILVTYILSLGYVEGVVVARFLQEGANVRVSLDGTLNLATTSDVSLQSSQSSNIHFIDDSVLFGIEAGNDRNFSILNAGTASLTANSGVFNLTNILSSGFPLDASGYFGFRTHELFVRTSNITVGGQLNAVNFPTNIQQVTYCLLYTSPSPRD